MGSAAEGFLIGVIATASVTAGFFFLKFWRRTKDSFFLWFAAAFIIEGLNRVSILQLDRPNEGTPRIYAVRLISFLLILAAVFRKNYSSRR